MHYYDTAGREVPAAIIQNIQLSSPNPAADMAAQGISIVGSYQPWDRFWTFQAIEALVFAALSLFTIGAMVWWVDRARS